MSISVPESSVYTGSEATDAEQDLLRAGLDQEAHTQPAQEVCC